AFSPRLTSYDLRCNHCDAALYHPFLQRSAAMNTAIRRIGDSEGVIFPKEMLERLCLNAGDEITLVEEGWNLRLAPTKTELSSQFEAARVCMQKYRIALRELAR